MCRHQLLLQLLLRLAALHQLQNLPPLPVELQSRLRCWKQQLQQAA
jgi:hypothetical protein